VCRKNGEAKNEREEGQTKRTFGGSKRRRFANKGGRKEGFGEKQVGLWFKTALGREKAKEGGKGKDEKVRTGL